MNEECKAEKTRIYDQIVDIDSGSIQSFWNSRAQSDSSIKSVLLGEDFAKNSGIIRNNRECQILCDFLGEGRFTVLDIGCGMGRWAQNLESKIELYHGIDFSTEYVKSANKSFENNPQITFFQMSALQLDLSVLLNKYDLIIMTAVAMYINDNEIDCLLDNLNKLFYSSFIYFHESVSILPHRLTLKDFDSTELKSKYNAIYRTGDEYEDFFAKHLTNYQFDKSATGLLLDKDTGARDETNAKYWFLKRKN